MNLTGAPAHCWLLCLIYDCSLLNFTLDVITPILALTGQVPDISHFLQFSFLDPVYYNVDKNELDHKYPSQSNEKRGHWVGFEDNKSDQLTWKILNTDETQQIITRSCVRSATKTSLDLRLDPPEGEDQPLDLISDVFVYGKPHPDRSEEPLLCPFSTLMTFWGEPFCFLWMRMMREKELPSLTMSTPWTKLKLPEKTNSGSDS